MKQNTEGWQQENSPMKILIYGINYAPELTGIGKYTAEMSEWLAKQGHKVTVVTALPYYPDWEVQKAYKGKWWLKEFRAGVHVIRCPLYVPKQVTALKRIIHEFSFLAGIFPVWLMSLFQPRHDVVVCISPPFHMAILPLIYAKIRGVKFINHIQDLQVDAAKDLGMIKNKHLLRMMFATEKAIFSQGTHVSTISEGMQKKLLKKGIATSKLSLFPNWVDSHVVKPLSREQSLREQFGINYQDKVILYSGNLGEKQGLEIIIEVAKKYSHRKDVHFVISGCGGGKENLMRLAREAGSTNVKFYPLTASEHLSALLAMADIHLVLQKKTASDLVMPSKINAILAVAGCAIVAALPGTTLHDIFHKHQMGILIEPESADALEKGIEMALGTDTSLLRLNARSYAENYLSMNTIIQSFEKKLIHLSFGGFVAPGKLVPDTIPIIVS